MNFYAKNRNADRYLSRKRNAKICFVRVQCGEKAMMSYFPSRTLCTGRFPPPHVYPCVRTSFHLVNTEGRYAARRSLHGCLQEMGRKTYHGSIQARLHVHTGWRGCAVPRKLSIGERNIELYHGEQEELLYGVVAAWVFVFWALPQCTQNKAPLRHEYAADSLLTLLWVEGWIRWPLMVPSNLNYSVSLSTIFFFSKAWSASQHSWQVTLM